jgi:hypothetical protein
VILSWQGPPPDSIRAAARQVFAAREYDWAHPPRSSLWGRVLVLFGRLLAWLDQMHALHPIRYYVIIGLMIAMLLAILIHFGYLIWRTFRHVTRAPAVPQAPATVRDAQWHLQEAQRLSEAQRYAEALGHRFLALVLLLERRRAVRFDLSKTPAEYVGEARLDEVGRGELAQLVDTLYRHLFGGDTCTAEAWVDFDRRAEAVGSHVASA